MTIEGEDDESLVEESKRGSEDAFRELVSRHKNIVFGLILRQIHHREIAEELSQEVFLKAYRGLSKFRSDASFKTWIIRIAVNTTRSYFRSRQHSERKQTDSDEALELPEQGIRDHDPVLQQEIRDAFQLCFGKLKDPLRDVMSLCGFEQKSYEEVAEVLKVPVGTIRSRLNRARLTVRECLERRGVSL